MDVWHDVLVVFDGLNHRVIKIPRMGSHEADPGDAGLSHIFQKIAEGVIDLQILAVGVDVLA